MHIFRCLRLSPLSNLRHLSGCLSDCLSASYSAICIWQAQTMRRPFRITPPPSTSETLSPVRTMQIWTMLLASCKTNNKSVAQTFEVSFCQQKLKAHTHTCNPQSALHSLHFLSFSLRLSFSLKFFALTSQLGRQVLDHIFCLNKIGEKQKTSRVN